MNRLGRWFHTTWITLAAALGIQYARPPVMDTSTPPAIVHALTSPTPTPTSTLTATGTLTTYGTLIASTPSPAPTPRPTVLLPYPEMILGQVVGATDAEMVMLVKANIEANQVLQSQCFKVAVLGYQNFTERNIWDTTTDLTNQQILDHISVQPITYGVNVFNGTWRQNYISKTMGYDVGDGVVYINRFYFDSAETAGSLDLHEAEGHGQGFHHYGVFSTSIPYKWNDFFDLCRGKP